MARLRAVGVAGSTPVTSRLRAVGMSGIGSSNFDAVVSDSVGIVDTPQDQSRISTATVTELYSLSDYALAIVSARVLITRMLSVGYLGELFVPGVTMPYYVDTVDFSGAKNVGNLPGVTRTAYSGTVTNGVTQIPAGTYTNLDFIDTIVDIRGNATFNNCRVVLGQNSYLGQNTIRAGVFLLNGSATLATFNDCEIHLRAQRALTAITGRNMVFNRCVVTGGIDGPSLSTSGAAPVSSGVEMNDCWIGALSYWRSSATPWEGHTSDTRTHNDCSQVSTATGYKGKNTVYACYPSPYVGTGTPGSSSDDGNQFVPATGNGMTNGGTNYITPKATQDAWRAADLAYTSTPSQSLRGVARSLIKYGSWAGVMVNRNTVEIDHCYFSGGLVPVNIMDTNVTGSVSIKRSIFYNDMVNGPGARDSDPTVKGYAMLVRSGLNGALDIPTSGADANYWFDGSIVTPTYA